MDLKQLKYFMHVAELGSFTQASLALDIAQPALSRQVRRLEVELHQCLLERNGRGVTTTQAGKRLLEHCRGITRQIERAREDLGRMRGGGAGRVVLGMPPSASRMLTVPLTRQCRRLLPDATLSITESLSHVLEQWLLAGQLDIALLYDPPPSANLELSPLTRQLLYLVGLRGEDEADPDVPLRALADFPLVIPNRPHTVRTLLEARMALAGCRPNIRLEIDGVSAILDLVADGAGYAVLTEHAVRTSTRPELYELRRIVQPELPSRLYLATSAERITTLSQTTMIGLIRGVVHDLYPASMTQPD